MHKRTASYTPSPSSLVYPCGQQSIRMLRASVYHWAELLGRFRAMQVTGRFSAENLASAVMLHILWDDEHLEWDVNYDGDELLNMPDEELLETGQSLARELYSVATLRMGLDVIAVMESVTKNLSGEGPNVAPLPTQS